MSEMRSPSPFGQGPAVDTSAGGDPRAPAGVGGSEGLTPQDQSKHHVDALHQQHWNGAPVTDELQHP